MHKIAQYFKITHMDVYALNPNPICKVHVQLTVIIYIKKLTFFYTKLYLDRDQISQIVTCFKNF